MSMNESYVMYKLFQRCGEDSASYRMKERNELRIYFQDGLSTVNNDFTSKVIELMSNGCNCMVLL